MKKLHFRYYLLKPIAIYGIKCSEMMMIFVSMSCKLIFGVTIFFTHMASLMQ